MEAEETERERGRPAKSGEECVASRTQSDDECEEAAFLA